MNLKRILALMSGAACVLLLAACQGREIAPSSSAAPPPPSSMEESSDVPVIESVELPPEEPKEPEPPPEDPYPVPILTDTEQSVLQQNLALFVGHIGAQAVVSPSALPPETVLTLCLDDISANKIMTAQVFETDKEDRELIPAELVTDTAQRLLGISGFSFPESELFDAEKELYAYAAPAQSARVDEEGNLILPEGVSISEIMGAPDDLVAYTVATNDGEYLYSCKLLRLNGIPYLQLVSVTVNR